MKCSELKKQFQQCVLLRTECKEEMNELLKCYYEREYKKNYLYFL